ncbi:MAG: hypothetical protein K0R78_3108 [Pelosinus sp.]|nr:hypothetical protein [Pelosinus sp.]
MSVSDYLFHLDISTKALMSHVAKISSWARIAGSEEEAKSFEYIKEQLKDIGAEVTLMHHDAYISLPESASLVIDGIQFPCQTHSMVPSTGASGLQADIVYVSGGKSRLSKENICDKIVMIDGRAVAEPVWLAQELGAAGVIFISGKNIYEMCISKVWGSPTKDEIEHLPKIPVVSVTQVTGDLIKEKITSGRVAATLTTSVRTEWCQIPLLTAEVKSSYSPEKFVMLSGHVDSWYYGATDNAAANAVMLEIGRLAVKNRTRLCRTLRLVFFSGHSQGRYAGSSWYSDHFWEDLHKNCFLNINVDVLGCKGAEDVTKAVTMAESKGVIVEVVKKITGADFKGKRYARHADQSFWGAGVSSALASFSKQTAKIQESGAFTQPAGGPTDLGWWWHTPHDMLDKVDPDNLLRDGRIFAAITLDFCSRAIIPLDYRTSVAELEIILRDWQTQAGDFFNLSIPIHRIEMLKEEVKHLYASTPNESAAINSIENFNTALLKLGRILVQLNYTQGKIFENDRAVSQSPMPALALIKDLAAADVNRRKMLLTELVRRRNYVAYALDQAIQIVQRFFGK